MSCNDQHEPQVPSAAAFTVTEAPNHDNLHTFPSAVTSPGGGRSQVSPRPQVRDVTALTIPRVNKKKVFFL